MPEDSRTGWQDLLYRAGHEYDIEVDRSRRSFTVGSSWKHMAGMERNGLVEGLGHVTAHCH